MIGDWPFEDPPNVAVITTRGIIDGTEWIHYVSHDEDDGGWQFLPYGFTPECEAALVGLRTIMALDPSVVELQDLPPSWCAWRESKDARWRRELKSG